MASAFWNTAVDRFLGPALFRRAETIVTRIESKISGKSVLDLGPGSGHVAALLQKNCGAQVTMLDVRPHSGALGERYLGHPLARRLAQENSIPYQYYDGVTIPFADRSFDTVLLGFMLHHCPDPDAVFEEAVRVAAKRVLVLEDVSRSDWEAVRTKVIDSALNLEFFNPHKNRFRSEWIRLFERCGMRLSEEESWVSRTLGLPMPHTMFVLDR